MLLNVLQHIKSQKDVSVRRLTLSRSRSESVRPLLRGCVADSCSFRRRRRPQSGTQGRCMLLCELLLNDGLILFFFFGLELFGCWSQQQHPLLYWRLTHVGMPGIGPACLTPNSDNRSSWKMLLLKHWAQYSYDIAAPPETPPHTGVTHLQEGVTWYDNMLLNNPNCVIVVGQPSENCSERSGKKRSRIFFPHSSSASPPPSLGIPFEGEPPLRLSRLFHPEHEIQLYCVKMYVSECHRLWPLTCSEDIKHHISLYLLTVITHTFNIFTSAAGSMMQHECSFSNRHRKH